MGGFLSRCERCPQTPNWLVVPAVPVTTILMQPSLVGRSTVHPFQIRGVPWVEVIRS